jgi:hypothetical protein
MVPFGCASEDCGRDVAVDAEEPEMIKEGKVLEEGRGMGDTDVSLGDGMCQRHL